MSPELNAALTPLCKNTCLIAWVREGGKLAMFTNKETKKWLVVIAYFPQLFNNKIMT